MADSIERRQNAPAVDAQVATPSIIEGPRMYVGGGQWVPVEMPPLVEKLSKPQKGEVLDSQSFDGVDTGSYTASWGSQNLAGLFAETEERTAVDRAAARLALDESARSRRTEAREIRLGRVAKALHRGSPEEVVDMLGKSKAIKWATGASKGKISATRPDAPERRVIEEQRIDSGQIARMDAWGIEALGPDVENPAERLTDEQFQHLTIEDQVERMWGVYETKGRAVDLQVPVTQNIPGLDIPKTLTVKDRRAMARNVELGKPKDQDPDRRGHIELVGVTSKWGRSEKVWRPWVGNRERVSEGDHVQDSTGKELQILDHVGLKRLAARDEQVELSEPYPWEAEDGSMVSEGLAVAGERDTRLGFLVDVLDVYGAAFYKEVEIVSAETLAAREGIDPDNAERRAEIREARQTLADQELI